MKKVYILAMLLLGVAVVFVSIVRASLEIMSKEDREGRLRVRNIEMVDLNYQIPEVTTLPTSPFYGIKELRDELWIVFSKNKEERVKMLFLVADKKIAESLILLEKGLTDKALIAGERAVIRLEQAWTLGRESGDNSNIDLANKVHTAIRAYGQIIEKIGKEPDVDQKKYKEVVEKLDEVAKEEAASYQR